MSKLAGQWIELFRAGDYPQGEFTSADIDQIVRNYNPQGGHEAPVAIGHPKGDAPAWAWVDKLKRFGDSLWGTLKDVQPEFEEMVQKRLFPKRSVGLHKNDKGEFFLHHLAYLGAAAPAVKGMADARFSSEQQVIEITFEEEVMAEDNKSVVDGLKAWFEEKFGDKAGTGAAPRTFSEADVTRIATEAATAAVKPLQAKLDEQATAFAEREKQLGGAEKQTRVEGAIARLKGAGRWVPAFEKMGLPTVFAALASSTVKVEFAEGDKKTEKSALDTLVEFLEKGSKIVPFGETYKGQNDTTAFTKNVPANADPASVIFNEKVEEYMKANKVDRMAASSAIAKEYPTHAGMTGGAV